MADEGGDRELPQRARGEARAATSPSGMPAAPVLSAELQQRLDAAVTAERSEAAARERDKPTGGEVTTPSVRDADSPGGTRPPGPGGAVEQQRPRAANAGPVTEDEVTE